MKYIMSKAKRIDNGGWGYGAFFVTSTGENSYNYYILRSCQIYEESAGDGLFRFDGLGYIVDPETVCQYIGFNDKNEIGIFENDIVKIHSDFFGSLLAVVKSGEYESDDKKHIGLYLEFQGKEKYSLRNDFLDWYEDNDFEVVGNIFDNPELSEV